MAGDVADFDIVVGAVRAAGPPLDRGGAALKVIGVLRGGTENVDVAAATRPRHRRAEHAGPQRPGRGRVYPGHDPRRDPQHRPRPRLPEGTASGARTFPNSDAIPELYEKTVGLVGYGAVGRLVAGYLAAFGSRILAFDPYFQGDPAPATLVALETLLRESDVVSIHARLTAGEPPPDRPRGSWR